MTTPYPDWHVNLSTREVRNIRNGAVLKFYHTSDTEAWGGKIIESSPVYEAEIQADPMQAARLMREAGEAYFEALSDPTWPV